MREQIECAVLLSDAEHDLWPQLAAGEYLGGRLVFHTLNAGGSESDSGTAAFASSWAMSLRRYDACLIVATVNNLGWCRRLLSSATGQLQTPMLAVTKDLKAAAINDLMALGLSEFVRVPVCYDEIRARINLLLVRHPVPAYSTHGSNGRAALMIAEPEPVRSLPAGRSSARPANQGCQPAVTEQHLCDTIMERTGLELDAYAVASAARSATSKESFRAAKGKVIERFERAYIAAALGRCSGNIAMAARAAQKHRRAFWALMRKYQIDASAYRTEV